MASWSFWLWWAVVPRSLAALMARSQTGTRSSSILGPCSRCSHLRKPKQVVVKNPKLNCLCLALLCNSFFGSVHAKEEEISKNMAVSLRKDGGGDGLTGKMRKLTVMSSWRALYTNHACTQICPKKGFEFGCLPASVYGTGNMTLKQCGGGDGWKVGCAPEYHPFDLLHAGRWSGYDELQKESPINWSFKDSWRKWDDQSNQDVRLPGYLSPSNGTKFGDIPNGLAALFKLDGAAWLQITVFAGFVEITNLHKINDPAKNEKSLNGEINNGRLAMRWDKLQHRTEKMMPAEFPAWNKMYLNLVSLLA